MVVARDFLVRLVGGGLAADGAMGTALPARGLSPGACPGQWNLVQPQAVLAVHRDHVAAGAEVVLTNTFGASRCRLERFALGDQVPEMNRRAVELARKAAGAERFVLGDIGPAGLGEPAAGRPGRRECFEAFCEQVRILADGGCDAIWIETQVALAEAELALGAARNACDLPVGVSFVFRRSGGGVYRTPAGDALSQVARRLETIQADFVGTNCCDDLESTVQATRLLRTATRLPIVVRPNAGLPRAVGGRRQYPVTSELFARRLPELWAAGASCLGGCCGTTAEHVRAIVASVPEGAPQRHRDTKNG